MSIFKKATRSNAFSLEEWRPVVDFPNYEVSSFGDVRSIRGHTIRQTTNKQGYRKVGLYRNSQQVSILVHRLVAAAFIPRSADRDIVNHIDCDKANNRPGNLEWVNGKENAEHAKVHGRYSPTTGGNHWTAREPWRRRFGERNGRALLTEDQARAIKSDNVTPVKVIADKFGVCTAAIRSIRKGRNWRHL